ncbi:type II toxin-antitoxin system VapC family toxin [Lyngbya sp. CCY1209]|jgi:predicted nucleic acid-binding protein|uniref:type II toxin-antitoxin system VapC family toxin n=1 Tax=Lyngbya sp. CCY1209 TaxID=2886103 RepID=UPI002D20BB88|nr:type II toxin-antitoxin system VapC family toxin [Lyngbya sp. CCY1209]MEB3885927.1 type II toxin-antitoxin system VapC family toxin [Lyngbya sp. CCY1209]
MGQLNLSDFQSVYIDTSVVIYTVEANPSYYSLLQPLWERFQIGDIELMTSELTLMEVLVMPIRQENYTLIEDYRNLLESTQIQLIPIEREILLGAAELRARTNLKTPDAIHATTAINANCDLFLTNDRAFDRISILSAIILDDVLYS